MKKGGAKDTHIRSLAPFLGENMSIKRNPDCTVCNKEMTTVFKSNGGYFWCYPCEINGLLMKLIKQEDKIQYLEDILRDIVLHIASPKTKESLASFVNRRVGDKLL